MIKALWLSLALSLVPIHEAKACHRFSVWKYPYPQRCHVEAKTSHDWYVELVATPPAPAPDPDQAEHDAAVAAHKDELNWLLTHVHDPDSRYTQQRKWEEEGKW
jgi:hypothetical protein